jgi:hypothetical protein
MFILCYRSQFSVKNRLLQDILVYSVYQKVPSIFFYSKSNQMHQFLKFILFWNNILHVSDCLSIHHQESEVVHTATGVCQTGTAACLLVGMRWNFFPLASRQQYLFDIYLLLYVQLQHLMMDGKTVQNVLSIIRK